MMDYSKRLGGVKIDSIIKLMFVTFDDFYADHRCGPGASCPGGACAICKAHRKFQAGLEKIADKHDADVLAGRAP